MLEAVLYLAISKGDFYSLHALCRVWRMYLTVLGWGTMKPLIQEQDSKGIVLVLLVAGVEDKRKMLFTGI